MQWSDIQHFRSEEFDSPDKKGSGYQMDLNFVAKLDRIRKRCGFPFTVLSGFRTVEHNSDVGGKDSSAHMEGRAADIACRTSGQRLKLVQEAMAEGICRIGIADTFVHLDDSPTLPQNVMWTY